MVSQIFIFVRLRLDGVDRRFALNPPTHFFGNKINPTYGFNSPGPYPPASHRQIQTHLMRVLAAHERRNPA